MESINALLFALEEIVKQDCTLLFMTLNGMLCPLKDTRIAFGTIACSYAYAPVTDALH